MNTFRPSPGVLREAATSAILGALHNAHQAGPWALVEVRPDYLGADPVTRLVFAVGPNTATQDDPEDLRPRLVVLVGEYDTNGRPGSSRP